MNALFKPVVELQKIGKGVDPKSVLCVFFKQGQCTKGDKCKFSHDLNVVRRTEKRNIYEDDEKDKEDMNDWDQTKLEDVVNRKHGVTNNGLPPTTIVNIIRFWDRLMSVINLDLQIFLGSCRIKQIWLVLVVPDWRKMPLQACPSTRFCFTA